MTLISELHLPLEDLANTIDDAIVDEPPFSVREGGMIKDGFNEELDSLRDIVNNCSFSIIPQVLGQSPSTVNIRGPGIDFIKGATGFPLQMQRKRLGFACLGAFICLTLKDFQWYLS